MQWIRYGVLIFMSFIWLFSIQTRNLAVEEVDKLFDGKIRADDDFIGQGDMILCEPS